MADPWVIGEELHRVVKRVDDFQNGTRIVAFEVLQDLQQVTLGGLRKDEVAYDADRSFCLSSSKNARPSLTWPAFACSTPISIS